MFSFMLPPEIRAMDGNYEERKIGKEFLDNGLTVSTAFTTDEGFETAVGSESMYRWVIVERYPSKEDATDGHKKWVDFAATGVGKTVRSLGSYDNDWVPSDVVLK